MIDGLHATTSLPALERSLQYMSARHRLLTSNLANIETPGFRPTDVSPQAFQAALRDAIEERRELWLRSARPGGLESSLAHDRAVLEDLEQA